MTTHQFRFTGKAGEYFGIWIVNLLLSIITLGIYTAWAKVRRVRYFYANTHLDDHNFEYHAKPMSILKGRIIVVAILLLLNVLVSFIPLAGILILPVYFLGLPWIINQAMRFNARVTSYRNVRFNFAGTYWGALKNFILIPVGLIVLVMGVGGALIGFMKGLVVVQGILAVVTLIALILVFPYMSKLISDYIGQNLSYGKARFYTNVDFRALLKNLGITVIFAFVIIAVSAVLGAIFGGVFENSQLMEVLESDGKIPEGNRALMASIFMGVLVGYVGLILAALFYRAGVRNLVYNATTLDDQHHLQSTLPRLKYIWVLVSNLVLTLLTLGLFRPWAAIRSWRLLSDNTALLAASDLGEFAGSSTPEDAAASAEFLDIEGIDFGF